MIYRLNMLSLKNNKLIIIVLVLALSICAMYFGRTTKNVHNTFKTILSDTGKEVPSDAVKEKLRAVLNDVVKTTPSGIARAVPSDVVKTTPSNVATAVPSEVVKVVPTDGVKTILSDNIVNKTREQLIIENKSNAKAISTIFQGIPSITLAYRLTSISPVVEYLYCVALKSASLYWSPYLGDIVLILDGDSKRDHELAKALSKHRDAIGLKLKFIFEEPIDVTTAWRHGYSQQLYSTFIMDWHIDTDVIGLTDTDAEFTTPVTLDNIFSGKKLKAKGMHTMLRKGPYFVHWRKSLQNLLGFPMVADFMDYFPVFIWRDTITNCRNHIVNHTKSKNIDEALAKVDRNSSPVSILLSYAFHFEKDRYDWHLDIREDTLDNYNKQFMPTGPKLLPSDITAALHMQIHYKHYCRPGTTNIVNKQAYCRAVRDTDVVKLDAETTKMCKQFKNRTPWVLFEFEWNGVAIVEHRTTWCKDKFEFCQNMIVEHYERVDKYVQLGIYDLNLKRVTAVHQAARDHGVQCKSFWYEYRPSPYC